MADQGKWFKLWCSSLHDESLENLSLEDWARWARLGAYIKEHGKDGKIRFNPPYRALMNLFRMTTLDAAKMVLQQFPGCKLGEVNRSVSGETNTTVSLEVEYLNWFRYQGDFSSNRVRKHREHLRRNETLQEERRQEVDKTRREETITPIAPKGASVSKILEWFENTWKNYPKERRIGKKAALRSYQRAVKDVDSARDVARALDNYLASKTVQDGFIKNAPTFFANWEDYKNDDRGSSPSFHNTTAVARPDQSVAGKGIDPGAHHAILQQLSDSTRFPK